MLRGKEGHGDWLQPGLGKDIMFGGVGANDFASYFDAHRPVDVSLQAGTATGSGADSLSGVEGISGSRFNDKLIGNAAPNRIWDVFPSASGADTITGLGGDDFVRAGLGNDAIDGGMGKDDLNGSPATTRSMEVKGANTPVRLGGCPSVASRHRDYVPYLSAHPVPARVLPRPAIT